MKDLEIIFGKRLYYLQNESDNAFIDLFNDMGLKIDEYGQRFKDYDIKAPYHCILYAAINAQFITPSGVLKQGVFIYTTHSTAIFVETTNENKIRLKQIFTYTDNCSLFYLRTNPYTTDNHFNEITHLAVYGTIFSFSEIKKFRIN